MIDLKDFSMTEVEEEDTSMIEVRSARAEAVASSKKNKLMKILSSR